MHSGIFQPIGDKIDQSKYVFIDTQHKAIKLYPLYRTLVSLSVHLSTHKAIKLYPLYRAMVALTIRKQSLYSTNYIYIKSYR